ncbi:hypothetical protein [Limnoraphis robusta]|uniref:Nucleotide-binding protein n=1 Tax=Limnoraphis robusta CS-951 TaxID=1637645 RepID=A0A0F5YL22_9CYAN|nr:hypothetical protein [Limnoraphis robusta]KKD39571.1 nucleotide-binding protein [Limnoraphis robusta CS-951]
MLIDRIKNTSLPPERKSLLTDKFSDEKLAGKVIGTRSLSGTVRQGADVEKRMAIDNNALRLQPLVKPGWGRQGIAYGPYTRRNGLAFAVFLLNGHNTSQVERIEPLKERLHRWLIGTETDKPTQRLWRWIWNGPKIGLVQRLLWWVRTTIRISRHWKGFRLTSFNENLAVGWFPEEVPTDPTKQGNSFIVHATGSHNGELWLRTQDNLLSTFRGLQNLQVYYVVILRDNGAAYYAASVSNATGLAAYPNMRPLGIDPFEQHPTVYAGFYQSILGQNGFRVDTRVYGAEVAQLSDLATWYGTAHIADDLTGEGEFEKTAPRTGSNWTIFGGNYKRTALGVTATAPDSLAILHADTPSGLVHVLVDTSTQQTEIQLIWRFQDENNYSSFSADGERCKLQIIENGKREILAVSQLWFLKPNSVNSLQILDDGETFSLSLNGQLVFGKWFIDPRLQTATGVGIGSTQANPSLYFRALEAHPRSIAIPSSLDLGSPWQLKGQQVVISDDFTGDIGELAGKPTSTEGLIWQKQMGTGVIKLTGNGAKVQADAQHPNPGRTAYTVEWNHPQFADLTVEITPPGTGRGQAEKGRGGFIFWQDAENYIILNNWLDDCYGGASISSFFYLNGFEELYDAVWTNVGGRISWGVSHQLRMIFDGMNYTALINDEPVLYRALTDVYPKAVPLSINRVGIVANWEWGNDTGSLFKHFIAKV